MIAKIDEVTPPPAKRGPYKKKISNQGPTGGGIAKNALNPKPVQQFLEFIVPDVGQGLVPELTDEYPVVNSMA